MRAKETRYKGCRFRSRLEARWAVFFDSLGVKWWYEFDDFPLHFDYEEFAKHWDLTEEELVEAGVPQAFKNLDKREYRYLPDFYLPELNYWIEVKGPNPTKAEIEKAFMLYEKVSHAARTKVHEAYSEGESQRAWDDLLNHGVYLLYGDIPWPYPREGNILGYGRNHTGYISNFFNEPVNESTHINDVMLMAQPELSWMECPLCSKIGIAKLDTPYCRECYGGIANLIWTHLLEDSGKSVGKNEATKGIINQEFFTSGHKSPRLQRAYDAARAARFEHGESPNSR